MADDKTVQVSEVELKALRDTANSIASLQKQIKALQTGEAPTAPGGKRIREIKNDTDRIVRVRFVEGKAVIGYKNRGLEHRPLYIYEVPDPLHKGQTILKVDLILFDGSKESVVTVDYKEFLEQADSAECRIVKVDRRPVEVDNQGITVRKEIDGYATVEKDEEVELIVTGEERDFIVRVASQYADSFRDGLLEINEQFINI